MTTTAKNFTKGPRKGKIRLIVVHSMESQEKPDTAESVAKWFSGPTAPQASAHFCIDNNSAVRVVDDQDIAWGAPGANADGLHIELAGKASQSSSDWLDAYSTKVLDQAAKVIADWCKKYNIPAKKLEPTQVRDGKTSGICGHIDVSRAWPNLGDHYDPGKNFPWADFIGRIQALLK